MDVAGYTALTRQSGLLREMRVLANNIANAGTTGFRQEGLVYSEYIMAARGDGIDTNGVSMTAAHIRNTSQAQGALHPTGGMFDLAVEGDGFFLIETPAGERLTRSGAFTPNAQGDLVTADGYRVLDVGGAPLFVPPDAGNVEIARDGTVSAGPRLLGQIGVVAPIDPLSMAREGGILFDAEDGWEPVEQPFVVQGFLERSNVDAVSQMARMIEVQRAYEIGQSFLDAEDQRVRGAIQTFVK